MELLIEANYTEFRKRYKKGNPFALISAFQGDLDATQNKQNNVFLRTKIKSQGYDMIRLLGRYMESDGQYESMMVFCDNPDNYKDFVRFLLYFGKRYYQNSVIIVDADSNIWEYATRQGSSAGALGSKKRYDKNMNGSNSELDDVITMYTRRTYELEAIRVVND
jgi:hypothetical protein